MPIEVCHAFFCVRFYFDWPANKRKKNKIKTKHIQFSVKLDEFLRNGMQFNNCRLSISYFINSFCFLQKAFKVSNGMPNNQVYLKINYICM